MTLARELFDEAQRLRKLALSVRNREVRAEIQEMIDELERRARELSNGDNRDAEVPEVPGHRLRLSELTSNQLLGRAQAYRNMAEGASTAWTRTALHRIAAALEVRVDARRKPVEEPLEPPG
jgi:hypothetical protein